MSFGSIIVSHVYKYNFLSSLISRNRRDKLQNNRKYTLMERELRQLSTVLNSTIRGV